MTYCFIRECNGPNKQRAGAQWIMTTLKLVSWHQIHWLAPLWSEKKALVKKNRKSVFYIYIHLIHKRRYLLSNEIIISIAVTVIFIAIMINIILIDIVDIIIIFNTIWIVWRRPFWYTHPLFCRWANNLRLGKLFRVALILRKLIQESTYLLW